MVLLILRFSWQTIKNPKLFLNSILDKKKKDENPTRNKMMAFCLAELEHGEADLHPCQIIKIRDRPLKPPPPPPVIPRWKLIRK